MTAAERAAVRHFAAVSREHHVAMLRLSVARLPPEDMSRFETGVRRALEAEFLGIVVRYDEADVT